MKRKSVYIFDRCVSCVPCVCVHCIVILRLNFKIFVSFRMKMNFQSCGETKFELRMKIKWEYIECVMKIGLNETILFEVNWTRVERNFEFWI